MLDLEAMLEYSELVRKVTYEKQTDCLRRVFANDVFPNRFKKGSLGNELRVTRFLKLMVEELRKEVDHAWIS